MNKIVKLIGYKPAGKQTSIVPINAVASAGLPTGNYTIRKYSYFLADGIQYNFIGDISFNRNSPGEVEKLETVNNEAILYQGSIKEYPDYTAQGEEFEVLPIVVDNIVDNTDDKFIADGTISVYVKEAGNDTYYEYDIVESLYLSKSVDRVCELRLNEYGHYEVKFGNGVFGKKLTQGDIVSVDYLLSDNVAGVISKNVINGNKLFVYDSTRQRELFQDLYPNKSETTFLNISNSSKITFNNPLNSSALSTEETVEQIRLNAPKLFSSQLRLVTEKDYQGFLDRNLANVITSTRVANNDSYINEYIQYFYDICVDPNKVNRVIINQVNFADACDFNNINVFVVPRFTITEDKTYPPFLSNSFKNYIVTQTQDRKMLSNTVVPRDPIYMAFGLGIGDTTNLTLDILDQTKLYAVRETNNKINKTTLKTRIASIIKKFFDPEENSLGQNLSLTNLTNNILSLEGIKRIETRNELTGEIFTGGVSFLSFNPQYPESDIELVNQDKTLPFFKFPYLYSPLSVAKRIVITDE